MSEPSLHEMVKAVYDYVIEQRQKEEEERTAKKIRAEARAYWEGRNYHHFVGRF